MLYGKFKRIMIPKSEVNYPNVCGKKSFLTSTHLINGLQWLSYPNLPISKLSDFFTQVKLQNNLSQIYVGVDCTHELGIFLVLDNMQY